MPDVKQLLINGAMVQVSAEGDRSLLGVLRDELCLTGAKYGCGEGRCDACTVLVDGEPVRSCVTKLSAVATHEIMTIEGLEKDGKLHPLQQAFLEVGAMQCGYCTCGMIMSGVGLLRKNPHPTREEIVEHMNGNICRCGTYPRIIAALATAAKSIKEARR
ncbi:MAG TPA: (2Fe-2S)-binding protein [Isosphaeraceae bacterium]|nr:(2Fe-2S)-binding protein [Isosphaeraceae bacterium]